MYLDQLCSCRADLCTYTLRLQTDLSLALSKRSRINSNDTAQLAVPHHTGRISTGGGRGSEAPAQACRCLMTDVDRFRVGQGYRTWLRECHGALPCCGRIGAVSVPDRVLTGACPMDQVQITTLQPRIRQIRVQ